MMRAALVAGLAAALVAATGASAAGEVAPGVEIVAGAFVPGSQPDGNSVLLRGPDGLVVVDTGRHPEHAARIVERARAIGIPVRAIVNTHWHLDHVGGNPILRREFPEARVFATDAIVAARTGFLARYREQLDGLVAAAATEEAKRPYRAELALLDAGPALEPDEVVAASGSRVWAGRTLDVRVATHAVTAGDLWLVDTVSRTLVAGDLVTLPAPFLDTACPAGWSAALGDLAATDFEILIPGHGPPMDRAAFLRYRGAFDALLACADSDAPTSACVDGWIDGAGEWIAEADRGFARALTDYYVGEVLRGDPKRLAAACGGTEVAP